MCLGMSDYYNLLRIKFELCLIVLVCDFSFWWGWGNRMGLSLGRVIERV